MNAVIRKVVDKHLDEAVAVGKMVLLSGCSPVMTARDARGWHERFENHLDALRTARDGLLPLVEERLLKGEPDDFFAAVLGLTVVGSASAVERIIQVIIAAQEPVIWLAIRDALFVAKIPETFVPPLAKIYETGLPPTSALVAEVLSGQGRLRKLPSRLPEFFKHELPFIRAAGWRIFGMFNDERIKPMKNIPSR